MVAPEDDSSSGDEDEDEEQSPIKTPNGRSHALSPASSSHSVPAAEQLLRTGSPKVSLFAILLQRHFFVTANNGNQTFRYLRFIRSIVLYIQFLANTPNYLLIEAENRMGSNFYTYLVIIELLDMRVQYLYTLGNDASVLHSK